MSIFRKSNKRESKELKDSEFGIVLKLNPRYFEEREIYKIRREIKGYM
ncbi:MAG: hypothetical protein ACXAC5_13340 [Promethearchaeota archaeon]|jgi:hypothetical protein